MPEKTIDATDRESLLFQLPDRLVLARRYKRLILALKALFEFRVMSEAEYLAARRKLEGIYKQAKFELKSRKALQKRGRPRRVDPRKLVVTCKKAGCSRAPARGQVYCSRNHAPYGNFGSGVGADE